MVDSDRDAEDLRTKSTDNPDGDQSNEAQAASRQHGTETRTEPAADPKSRAWGSD